MQKTPGNAQMKMLFYEVSFLEIVEMLSTVNPPNLALSSTQEVIAPPLLQCLSSELALSHFL